MTRNACLVSCLTLLIGCASGVSGSADFDADPFDPKRPDADPSIPVADGGPGSPDGNPDDVNVANCDTVPSGWSRVGAPIDPPGGLFDFGDIAVDSAGRPAIFVSGGAPADG